MKSTFLVALLLSASVLAFGDCQTILGSPANKPFNKAQRDAICKLLDAVTINAPQATVLHIFAGQSKALANVWFVVAGSAVLVPPIPCNQDCTASAQVFPRMGGPCTVSLQINISNSTGSVSSSCDLTLVEVYSRQTLDYTKPHLEVKYLP
jgi:hypothetical protein